MSQELTDIRNLLRPHGFDLSAYTDAFLQRRVLIRMRKHQMTSLADYAALLARDGAERRELSHLLTVTVTEFFRDDTFSDTVFDPLFSKILARIGAKPLNAWSAGCATGQEPYSLAFLLDSFLTARGRKGAFAIHATDISEQNLRVASDALYPKNVVQMMPPRYQRYFEDKDGQSRVVPEIRARIQFQRHDLCDKPPFANLDLILCRNVMIYLTPAAKNDILKRFHAALAPGGFLVLGASEIILEPTLFKALDTRHKLYERI